MWQYLKKNVAYLKLKLKKRVKICCFFYKNEKKYTVQRNIILNSDETVYSHSKNENKLVLKKFLFLH